MSDTPDGLTPAENLVAQGAMVMRFENEQMHAVALAHRRNEQEVKDRALAILEADADAVANAYYSIPYKEHTKTGDCTRKQNDPCPLKPVEGIGIDGCRELARLWGNNATRVYFTSEDDERIWLSGVFVDLESNTRVELPYGVSRLGVASGGGGVYTLNPTRLGMAIQAGVSKAARNAIANGLPRSLRQAYFDKAKELLSGSAVIDVSKLVEAFEGYAVTREMLEGLYGCGLEELTAEQRKNLRGLFVAIREGLVDKEKHFAGAGGAGGGATAGTGAAPQPNGVTSAPSAPSGTAEVRGGTEAAPAAPAPEPAPAPAAAPAAAPGGGTQGLLHAVPDPTPFGRPPEAWETGQEPAAASHPNARTEAEWREEGELANAAARETATPSQPSPSGVQSPAPNDDDDEPGQPDLKGLGI